MTLDMIDGVRKLLFCGGGVGATSLSSPHTWRPAQRYIQAVAAAQTERHVIMSSKGPRLGKLQGLKRGEDDDDSQAKQRRPAKKGGIKVCACSCFSNSLLAGIYLEMYSIL